MNDNIRIFNYISKKSFLEFKDFYRNNNADVNSKTKDRLSLLMFSIMNGRKDIALFLLDNGANITEVNKKGFSSLLYAISYGMHYDLYDVIKKMLEINLKLIDILNNSGTSPLERAIHCNNGKGGKVFKLILGDCSSKSIKKRDKNLNSPLDMAKKRSYHKIIKMLNDKINDTV